VCKSSIPASVVAQSGHLLGVLPLLFARPVWVSQNHPFAEGLSVRIAGWILLVGGFFLCVSVVWAALGFLLMGVGLVSLQVAEQDRRRARSAIALSANRLDMRQEKPTVKPPPVLTEGAARRTSLSVPSYDKETWRRLVENDSDLLRLTSILADYGQQYVDELANGYLTAIDKKRLPAIVEGIIATAERNASTRKMSGPEEPIVLSFPTGASTVAMGLRSNVEDDPVNDAPQEPSGSAAAEDTFVDPPEASQERWNTTVTSADDDLAEMIRKFAPDQPFQRKI
jgi:hypothetical protein